MRKKLWIFMLLFLSVLMTVPAAFAESETEELNLEYSHRGKDIYRLGNTGYLVEDCRKWLTESSYQRIHNLGNELNELVPLGGNVKKYLYFIESSRSVDLSKDLSGENEAYRYILENFENDGHDTLAIDDISDYMNWFYMSDHHWNYKGSYQGYCDIVRMIFGEDEPVLVPEETVVFEDIPFNGSYNSELGYSHCPELFTVYRFPEQIPYTAISEGSPLKTYGRQDTYFNGKYPRITVYNHYSRFYGGDPGELIIQTNQPDKPNLLLISNSFSDSINLLLAEHFNTIYKVDPRLYKINHPQGFSIQRYLQKNGIDTVLWMGDVAAFSIGFTMR